MSPWDTSVYSDNMSATTWTVILAVFVLIVVGLMVTLIAMVHRASEATATPRPKRSRRSSQRHAVRTRMRRMISGSGIRR